MEEANFHREPGILLAANQNLRLHEPGVTGCLRFGMSAWKKAAKRPALPVLYRRPIGVEDIPLVENSVDNLIHQRPVHVTASSPLCRTSGEEISSVSIAGN